MTFPQDISQGETSCHSGKEIRPSSRTHPTSILLAGPRDDALPYHTLFLGSFRSPDDPEKSLVKRIIALEGDLVKPRPNSRSRGQMIKIPKGHCWVEGDNWASSRDSNTFGPVWVLSLACVPSFLASPLFSFFA